MSRCYPFPPPGYAGKCSSHEALILSIKLQKERERAISDNGAEKLIPEKSKSSSEKRKDKEDRKKDKKSKEERKKEKKEKRREKKQKDSAPIENGKLDDVVKLSKDGNVAFEPEGKLELQRGSTEFLERSIVTEEHGQPIDSQNASCSSDSTGNSGKRKKLAASPSGIQSNGNIIRIRFSSSQKRDEPSTSGSKEQEAGPIPHPTSYSSPVLPGVSFVKPESSLKNEDVITNGLPLPVSQNTATSLKLDSLKDKTTENPLEKEKPSSHHKRKSRKSLEKLSSREKKKLKKEALYQKLFVEWVPPPLERTLVIENNDDEEEWLFGKKGDEDRSAKRLRTSEESQSQNLGDTLPCSVSAVLQPRAHLLADVGMYALPFTVPF